MELLKQSRFNVFFDVDGTYVLVNTLTGAIIEFTSEEYNAFRYDINSFSMEQIALFKEDGFLVNNYLNEIALLRNAYIEKKYGNDAATIIIATTLECNFACPYCFENHSSGQMDENVQENLIKKIETLFSSGIKNLNIDWFGGEPLLYPSIIINLSKKINKLCTINHVNVSYSITTNGYLLDSTLISMLKQNGLEIVKITLDGSAKIHDTRRKLKSGKGTFDKIIENISKIQELSIAILVRVNIDKSNIDYYSNVVDILKKYRNVTVYPAIVTLEKNQAEEQASKCYLPKEHGLFYQEIQNKTCYYNLNNELNRGVCSCMAEHKYSFVVDPQGYIYKCVNDIGHIDLAYSSVFDNEMFEISTIAKYLGRDPFTETECETCPYIPLCYGGCISEYDVKGFHMCSPAKYLFKELIVQNIKGRS